MSQTPEVTSKTTEQLLEQYSVTALAVINGFSQLGDAEINFLEKNEFFIIGKMSEEQREDISFEYIGGIFFDEFLRLLVQKKIDNLTHLYILNSQLANLPSEITQLQNLTYLDISRNQLTSLPPEISQLQNLKEFNLDGNQLTNLPSEISQLQNLKELTLAGNQLTNLSLEITRLQNLKELNLAGNQLSSLPPEISQLQNLKELNLNGNQLTNLPPEISQLQNLKELNLNGNQLTNLPPEISQLQNLEELNLAGNQLTHLPPEFIQLQNLISLDISRNRLTNIPIEITKLPNLISLVLSGNTLINLPPEIDQLQNLEELYLAGTQLTSLTSKIGQLQNLTGLYLRGNQLISLPSEIAYLQNLKIIDLASNQLNELQSEIFQLKKLIELDLTNNQLKTLPIELWQLQDLKILHISSNPLLEIPVEMWRKYNWEQLGLSSLKIKSLPPEIGQCVNLIYLDLSYNQLTNLPSEIGQLTNLRDLGLFSNKLISLPKELAQLKNLKSSHWWRNPLEIAIPAKWLGNKDIWNRINYSQEILAYYKQMHEEGGGPLGEARVLVVGEADAGKTKLLRALLHGEHGTAFKDARDPTDGIEVNSFEADDIKLRYWDFGGQELYHATHRFFLSRRCVYVLVADATKDSNYNEEKIEYWLELLKFFGGDSPVILVASKVENYSLNVNERRLQEKYPNLVKMPALRTSAKTGAGIEDLRCMILEQVKSLPSISVMLPRSFLAVKDALEKIKNNKQVKIIEDSVYRNLCEENGITDEERQNTLLALLHDMGVVLHYEDDRLSDFGILNPDWATGGVYKVVNSPQIEKSQGRFTLAEIKSILADEELYPASMRRRIVDLMKKFELTFELPFERDAFILPSALPRKQPELNGWDVPCMTFEYRYPLLQVSIMHRFIVAEHDLIQDGLVWYSGLVIARGDNQALVIADTRDKRITIKVKGTEESRKEFLYSIRLQFERIHGGEAKPEEYVYSPQHPELSLLFADMKTMVKTEREYKVVHKGKMVNINLPELLDGFITSGERRKDEEHEKQEGRHGNTYITNNNISLGNMEGSSLIIGDSNTSNVSVQNSFNTFPAELQNTLIELIKSCETLLQKAESSEHTEEIRDELETLQNEAKKSKPKKERVMATAEGLAQAAKNLNEIGQPVMELAMTVIKLINTLPG